MIFTFKLARRLARFRPYGLMATLILAACSGGDSPNEPQLDPNTDPSAIDISPDSVSVAADGSVQFTASGGEAASYRSWRWKHRVASVSVSPGWVKLEPGTARTFTASSESAYGTDMRTTLEWDATGGTIDGSGKYVAGKTPGQYIVIASAANGVADTARVVIEDGGDVTRQVTLSPASATLAPGAQQRFTLTGTASDRSSFSVDPDYDATGGSISSGGTFTAGWRTGAYRVIATDRGTGLADTAEVTIENGGSDAVASVTVDPSSATLAPGETQELTATALDGSGDPISGAAISWSTSNPMVVTVSSNGLVSAVGGGEAVVTATSGGKSGDATIVVEESSGGTGFAGCPSSGYTRLVSVSSSSQLSSAISNAQPGDQIRLAAGTYSGIRNITRSGTQSRPIVLCGPRTAVFTSDTRLNNVDWWVLQGFTMRDGFQPIYAMNSSYIRVQGMEIYNTGQEAIHFRCGSTDNLVQSNWIHDTGRSTPQYGEGVYLGTDQTQWSSYCGGIDHSDRNKVIDNKFGPNVRGDHIDIKEGTTGGVIRGNTFDGTGTTLISGMVYDWITVKGNGYTIESNRGSRAPRDGIWGFVKVQGWGNNNVYRNNNFDVRASGYGIRSDGGSGNVVYCDNVVTNAGSGKTNVSCR
jgi:hypothetical protein